MSALRDRLYRLLPSLHVQLYRATNGRVGSSFGRANICLLTARGRKSGQERTVPLNYMPDGSHLVLIASNGGQDRPPAWFLNVQADPSVTVQRGRHVEPMTARVASREEKAELWPRIVAWYANYARYQARTTREIPVVILEQRTP